MRCIRQGAHSPGKPGEPGIVREPWKNPKSQGIVREFCQRSGNFDISQGIFISKLILLFDWFFLPRRSRLPGFQRQGFTWKSHVTLIWIFDEMVRENLELSGNFISQNEWTPCKDFHPPGSAPEPIILSGWNGTNSYELAMSHDDWIHQSTCKKLIVNLWVN